MYTPIPGQPHEVGTEAEVLATIRNVLTEDINLPKDEKRSKWGARLEKVQVKRTVEATPEAETTPPPFPKLGSQDRVDPEAPGKLGQFTVPSTAGIVLFGMHIRPRHVALAGVAVFIYLKPMWVMMALVLLVLGLGMVLTTIGAGPIWKRILARLHKLDQTNPERAAYWRGRLDRIAGRWDRVLDMLPERLVEGLYFPDLQMASVTDVEEEAFIQDRLARMAREA